MIKLFLADDHSLILDGLKLLISNYEQINLVGVANNIEELKEALNLQTPDILILDIKIGNDNSLNAIDALLDISPALKIILFSSYNYPSLVKRALEMDIYGYLLKDTTPTELISAIETVNGGDRYIGKQVNYYNFESEEEIDEFDAEDPFLKKLKLSGREIEVVQLILEGLESKAISERLFISINTVKTHRKNILKKLDLKNSSELIKFILESGWFK